jgi:hypothetical protein
MQQRTLGKARRYRVAVWALVSALAMVGCGGGDDNETTTRTVSNVSVASNASTLQALVGQQFTIPNGSALFPGLPNTPVVLTFTSSSAFILTGGGTATGVVTFPGSCAFTVSTSNIAGLPANTTTPTFTICNFVVTATVPLEAGGATGPGTVVLQLGRNGVVLINATLPAGVTVTVAIDANGQLVINSVSTGVPVPPTTGTTGTGGTP